MRSFHFWFRVCRPHHCLAAALGAWIVSLLSNGPEWINSVKLAAASSLGLGCLGASLFHFGAANKMYARKYWDIIEIANPKLLIGLGLAAFSASLAIAIARLPVTSWLIVLYNVVAVILYARILSRHWVTKNLVIALVCASPILAGWFSGHRLHPAIPFGIVTVFCAYWSREIIKDVTDIEANRGIRVTLPIWLGVTPARKVAGALAVLSSISLLALGQQLRTKSPLVIIPYVCSVALFLGVTYSLFEHRSEGRETGWIIAGTWLIMISFFSLRLPSF